MSHTKKQITNYIKQDFSPTTVEIPLPEFEGNKVNQVIITQRSHHATDRKTQGTFQSSQTKSSMKPSQPTPEGHISNDNTNPRSQSHQGDPVMQSTV
jgi:hypothetical protein